MARTLAKSPSNSWAVFFLWKVDGMVGAHLGSRFASGWTIQTLANQPPKRKFDLSLSVKPELFGDIRRRPSVETRVLKRIRHKENKSLSSRPSAAVNSAWIPGKEQQLVRCSSIHNLDPETETLAPYCLLPRWSSCQYLHWNDYHHLWPQ